MKTVCMKLLLGMGLLALSLMSCASGSESTTPAASNNNVTPTGSKMRIQIGNRTFTATLYDNATAAAFQSLLSMTVRMIELNDNEKYADLSRSLPTAASNPGTIGNRDLMLYGSFTLVLFYKTFSTSYPYTRLGFINNVTGLCPWHW